MQTKVAKVDLWVPLTAAALQAGGAALQFAFGRLLSALLLVVGSALLTILFDLRWRRYRAQRGRQP